MSVALIFCSFVAFVPTVSLVDFFSPSWLKDATGIVAIIYGFATILLSWLMGTLIIAALRLWWLLLCWALTGTWGAPR